MVEAADKIDPPTPKATARQAIAKIEKQRIGIRLHLFVCEGGVDFLGSARASRALFGASPKSYEVNFKVRDREGAIASMRGACAPQNQTRERLRPELRVYFTGRRFGSILVRPVPLFTSMI